MPNTMRRNRRSFSHPNEAGLEQGSELRIRLLRHNHQKAKAASCTSYIMRIQPAGPAYSYRTVGQSRRFQTGPIPTTGSSDTGNHPGGGVSLSVGKEDQDDDNHESVSITTISTSNNNYHVQVREPEVRQHDQQNLQCQNEQQKDKNTRARTPSQLKGDAKPFVPMAARPITPAKASSAETSPTSVVSQENKSSEIQQALTLGEPTEKPVDPSDVITPQKLMDMYLDSQRRQRAATLAQEQSTAMSSIDGKLGGKNGHSRSATIGTSARDFQVDGSRPPFPFPGAKIAANTSVGAAANVIPMRATNGAGFNPAAAGNVNHQQQQPSRSAQGIESIPVPIGHQQNSTPTTGNGISVKLKQPQYSMLSDGPRHTMNKLQITPTRAGLKFQQESRSDGSSNGDITKTPSSQRSCVSHVPHPYFQYQSPNTHAMLGRNGATEKQVVRVNTDNPPEKWEVYDIRRYKYHPKNRLQPPVEEYEPAAWESAVEHYHHPGYIPCGPGPIVVSEKKQQYWDAQRKYERQLADKESGVIVRPLHFGVPAKQIMANRSEELQALTQNGHPSLQDVLDANFLPFTACFSHSFPTEQNGVVILKNIPYETTRGECIALLGKNSRILSDASEPVHIIMDRVTSKTQDAYCELSSFNAAIELVEKFKKGNDTGRVPRLGNRIIEVELGSQTSLMQALFPSTAHGVEWVGATPHPIENAEYEWDNFKGFVTEEEMSMLSKHVEAPQRSSFARICPERPYECMISTLRKIPWYMAGYITVKQRQSVYESSMKMIKVLAAKLEHSAEGPKPENERLTPQLYNRLVTSAMLCPGFSVVQKHNIAVLAGLPEEKVRGFNQPRFPDSWRHQWTLAPKPGVPIDVLEWYIAVIRDETNRVVQSLNISQRMPLQKLLKGIDAYWGYFWAEVNFPVGPDFDNMTLEECNNREWQAIEKILTRAIQGGAIPFSYTTGSNFLPQAGPKRVQRRTTMAQS